MLSLLLFVIGVVGRLKEIIRRRRKQDIQLAFFFEMNPVDYCCYRSIVLWLSVKLIVGPMVLAVRGFTLSMFPSKCFYLICFYSFQEGGLFGPNSNQYGKIPLGILCI